VLAVLAVVVLVGSFFNILRVGPGFGQLFQVQGVSRPSEMIQRCMGEFAIYTYNFGNFRGELNNIYKHLAPLTRFGIQGYLFTDVKGIKPIDGWEIVHINIENTDSINGIPASRIQSKTLKYKFHPVLEKHRYFVHVDAKGERIDELATGRLAH